MSAHTKTEIMPYLQGRLKGEAKIKFEEHVRGCMACTQAISFDSLMYQASLEPVPAAPAGLSKKIFDRIASEHESLVRDEVKRSLRFMWMRSAILASFLLAALGTFLFTSLRAPYAETSLVKGSIDIKDLSGKILQHVSAADFKQKFVLKENQNIILSKNAQAVIYPKGMGSITVSSGSHFTVKSLPAENYFSKNDLNIKLESGTLYATVEKLEKNGQFLVETPLADVKVRGTVFEVGTSSAAGIHVKVFNGMVQLGLGKANPEKHRKAVEATKRLLAQTVSKEEKKQLIKLDSILNDGIILTENAEISLTKTDFDSLMSVCEKIAADGIKSFNSKDSRLLAAFEPAQSVGRSTAEQASVPKLSVSWTKSLPDEIWYRPAIGKQTVFVADRSGNMMLFDKKGIVINKAILPSPISAAAVENDNVLAVPTAKDGIVLFDSLRLKEIRSINFKTVLGADIITGPGGVFYAASSTGSVCSFNKNGFLWQVQVGSGIFVTPVADQGRVFVATRNGSLFSLDAGSGKTLWSTELGWRNSQRALLLTANQVVAVGPVGELRVFAVETGRPLRTEFASRIVRAAVWGSEICLMNEMGEIRLLNADKIYKTSLKAEGEMCVSENVLYVPEGKKVTAIDLVSGNIISTINIQEKITGIGRNGSDIFAIGVRGTLIKLTAPVQKLKS